MAHPDAVVAVDLADGATVWRIDGAVTSWFASGDTVVIFNGSTMSLLSFDSGSESEPVTALPTSAPTAGGAPALSPDDLRNSTLEVPDGRCSSAGSKDPNTGAARGGVRGLRLPRQRGAARAAGHDPGLPPAPAGLPRGDALPAGAVEVGGLPGHPRPGGGPHRKIGRAS